MGTLPQALFFLRNMAPIFLKAPSLWVGGLIEKIFMRLPEFTKDDLNDRDIAIQTYTILRSDENTFYLEVGHEVVALTLFEDMTPALCKKVISSLQQWCVEPVQIHYPRDNFSIQSPTQEDGCYALLQKLIDGCHIMSGPGYVSRSPEEQSYMDLLVASGYAAHIDSMSFAMTEHTQKGLKCAIPVHNGFEMWHGGFLVKLRWAKWFRVVCARGVYV